MDSVSKSVILLQNLGFCAKISNFEVPKDNFVAGDFDELQTTFLLEMAQKHFKSSKNS